MDSDVSSAAFALNKGEVSDIVESQFGYHIIKVEDIKGDRIRARHILVHVTPNEEDEKKIVEKMKELRREIVSVNTTFDEAAKQYSDDENSRDFGGKLDWLTTDPARQDGMLPSFAEQAKKMKPGDISEPFKSEYGYHLLKVDGYKPAHELNIKDDRNLIEQIIAQKKILIEYERLLRELRGETYIDIRLD